MVQVKQVVKFMRIQLMKNFRIPLVNMAGLTNSIAITYSKLNRTKSIQDKRSMELPVSNLEKKWK